MIYNIQCEKSFFHSADEYKINKYNTLKKLTITVVGQNKISKI